MVYNPCPAGFRLQGGVCVPISDEALKAYNSRKRKPQPQPQPDPEPEPPKPPEPPEPPEPEPQPDPEPEPPEPEPQPQPDPEPEPQPEPPQPERFKKVDTTGMSQKDVAALLTSAGLVVSGAAVRSASLPGGIEIFQGSSGTNIVTTAEGQGLGDVEGIELSVLGRQEETTLLLGEDEAGNVIAEEMTPLLEESTEAGVELTELGGVETAAEASIDETAGLIAESTEAMEGLVEVGEIAEVAEIAGESALIAGELGTAAALAPETLGASLIVGGLVVAGTEAVVHADEIAKGVSSAEKSTEKAVNKAFKSVKNWF